MSEELPPILGMLWPDRCDNERHWLFRKSEVFRYAMEGTTADNKERTRDSNSELVMYVSEQCVAAGRLMQVAISQYESVASGMQGSCFVSRTLPAWTFISSAYSAVDALAAAIAAIISGVVPPADKIPGLSSIREAFKKNGQKDHLILEKTDELRNSKWYELLKEARHGVLHHGFWPLKSWEFDVNNWHIIHSPFFRAVSMTNGSGSSSQVPSSGKILELREIAEGFLWGLEKWEASIAGELTESPWIWSPWPGPVIQIIRLKDHDHGVPEADFLAENSLPLT